TGLCGREGASPSLGAGLCVYVYSLMQSMDQRDTWDRFYAQREERSGHFDWFFGYETVSGILLPTLQGLPPGPARLLDVGCGTSALGLELYRNCPRPLHVSCVDFSPVAVERLRRLLQAAPPPRHPLSRLGCHVADATNLGGAFEGGSFHLVFDKGTCDSLLRCPRGPGRAGEMVAECLRMLRPGGTLFQFSDEDPDARVPFLERASGCCQAGGGSVTVREAGQIGGICYYVYMLGRRVPEAAGQGGGTEN
uniref:Citrate synthase-lysine N-methyltransferase CSKMT, mitochondrial n=1 Tax=Sphenodon punctatus TaxID=8508 RepID=A0A8D0GTC0_SPHPU